MFPHGAQKMLGWFGGPGFTATMTTFTDVMGIPGLFAFIAIITEFFGSLALIAGAVTRLWALCFSILMTVAIFMNHLQHGLFMNWMGQKAGEGFEYHLLVIGIAIALTILGGGKWSLDNQLTSEVKTTK
jgi:putative oxidoreductase